MKITIGIPAYNEEKNIGNLLNDIQNQKLESNVLEKILIVSDNSTDKTNEIVSSFMRRYDNIQLIIKENREGKRFALNLIFDISDSDILILLDADIRLDTDTLNSLEEFFEKENIGLIAGNPIPYQINNLSNLAEQASFFSWILLDKIKKISAPNLYHCHGRILAMTKKLYKNILLSDILSPGDDQSIYLCCVRNGLKLEYAPKAKVFYKLPKTMKDYLKQNIRFSIAIKEKEKHFGKSFMKRNMGDISNPLIFLGAFMRYPYKGLCWIILFTSGKLSMVFRKQRISLLWEISKTTK